MIKITPAHDPNDFEVGLRHNLEKIAVINEDATMNENAFKYAGLTREKCREELLKDLETAGLLLKVEPIIHSVGHSERTGAIVEPYLSKQWFVKMKPLANKVLENQKDKDNKVNFVPKRYEKTMNHWMEITYDWCISRQLWWGHRIPAWYKDDAVYVGTTPPNEPGWVQDEDVLDTWFSSALWPFATLGWPDNTDLMQRYFPNNVLVTGYDIIPFWVNRMTFQSLKLNNKRPFKDCIIHGLIRDKEGRKFSKSLGNGIDPFDMVDKYGADSLRYYLTTDVSLGTDLRFDEIKISSTWNYINKIWNASRFVLMNINDLTTYDFTALEDIDKWVLTKFMKTLKTVTKHMEKYDFNVVSSEIYDFVWNTFCDYYIEFAKYSLDNKSTKSTLCYVLSGILKTLHPFIPFVTEEIYQMLPIKDSESIMISSYPTYDSKKVFKETEEKIDDVILFIKNFRNKKSENNLPKDIKIYFEQSLNNDLITKVLRITDNIIKSPLNIKEYKVVSKYIKASIFYERIETEEEKALKENEIASLKKSIERRESLLKNENYVNKAPKHIVEMERAKLLEEQKKLTLLEA